MEAVKKILTSEKLELLVQKLREEGNHLIAPVEKNKRVEFAVISSLNEMAKDYILTKQSAKPVVFPKAETLFHFTQGKDNLDLKDRNTEEFPGVVLIGGRPCDAWGFNSLRAIFTWDITDSLFARKLEKLTIISMSCTKSDSFCFCTSVNMGPGSTKGSDILLTPVNDREYLAECITDKGKQIAQRYQELFAEAGEIDKEKYLADVPVVFNLEKLLTTLPKSFNNKVWEEQSLRCIGCGACAFVCPTCACFDIQDVTNGKSGYRKRSWDSCGFSLFTLHTSGHNPREVQSARWRQRVMHKYAYMPERQQVVGCVGCGRCSRSCPSDMNLKEHMINLVEEVAQ
jgi:sulfhydrogenase subunit beta (sulfur reductase)